MKITPVLFDADGVLTLPEEVFSLVYTRSRGLDIKPFEQFFRNNWPAIVTGKKDLKESIAEKPELWQWDGSAEELLNYWFKTEDVRNDKLLALISELRTKGVPCYLATEQERYRGEYVQNVMFKNQFDGYFITADLGVTKANPKFFEIIIDRLKLTYPSLEPQDIVFFDDSQSKIDTALSLGINAQLYKGVERVQVLLPKH